jgi:hypothetical protein
VPVVTRFPDGSLLAEYRGMMDQPTGASEQNAEEICTVCRAPIAQREGRYRILAAVYDVQCFSKLGRGLTITEEVAPSRASLSPRRGDVLSAIRSSS